MSGQHNTAIANRAYPESKVLFNREGKLCWTVFKVATDKLFIVCTPSNSELAFIPVLKFAWRLQPDTSAKEGIETPQPKTEICDRAVTITAPVTTGFAGKIHISATVDNYEPFLIDLTWRT